MIVSEYTKGLKNNYVRIRLLSLPDERKYQYCIMKRGGITGFLPFEIRYIDTDAYMYYDITSRQNISTLYSKKPLDRKWLADFFAAVKKIKNEAVRFLLDPSNLIWNPSNVYRDLTNGRFGFLYVPYLDEDNGMREMIDFIVGHVDYSDDELVRCVYEIAEQYKESGDIYLAEKVYMDVEALGSCDIAGGSEGSGFGNESGKEDLSYGAAEKQDTGADKKQDISDNKETDGDKKARLMDDVYENAEKIGNEFCAAGERPMRLKPRTGDREKRKRSQTVNKSMGLFSFIKRVKERDLLSAKDYGFGEDVYGMEAVADEMVYSDAEREEASEGTVFVDLSAEEKKARLESENGSLLCVIEGDSFVIGKKEAEADLVIDEPGVSRMHAKVFLKDGEYYLEDLNSTNGTFKNGMKLKPYEQKKLAKGDEIRIATRKIVFN